MHVSGHTATTASMHLIGGQYFLYRYRVQCDRAFKPAKTNPFVIIL